ncbi:hypothetical protein AAF712_011521 [Marasmius tenuissimus]|uniref:Uncharacterized protein n=1 Tax=Marasmius tenuissimus TaxID=585030 RepID=A0ABR2ZJX0_9AGAR
MADIAIDYPRQIVVDDTDSRITYETGTWDFDLSSFDRVGVFGRPYNETMKGTNSASASFTFTFEGEYIRIKGAKDNSKLPLAANSTDPLDLLPKYTCQIDGRAIAPVAYIPSTYVTTNVVLCEQSHLAKANHTISMNISMSNPDTQIFWLDSIEYAPLEGANLTSQVLKVDSSDTNCIYHNSTGDWQVLSALNITEAAGASMSFKFNGTSVSLYGTNLITSANGPFKLSTTGSYYIDSGASVSFDIPASKRVPFIGSGNNFTAWSNQLLFTTGPGLDGSKEHEIVITYTGVNGGTVAPQWLTVDYFLVGNNGSQVKGNPSESGGGGKSVDNGMGKTGKPTGVIVGAVVGGVFGLLLIAGLVWYVMKKRKGKDSNPSGLNYGESLVAEAWRGEPLPRDSGALGAGTGAKESGDARRTNFADMKHAQREVVNQQISREMDTGSGYSQVAGSSLPPGASTVAPPIYTPW